MNKLEINVKGATDEQVNSLIQQYGDDHAVKMGFKFALAFLDEELSLLTIEFLGETPVDKPNSIFGGVSLTYDQKLEQEHMNSFNA